MGCDRDNRTSKRTTTSTASDAGVVDPPIPEEFSRAPSILFLPDGGDVAMGSEFIAIPGRGEEASPAVAGHRCPPEMVDVNGAFCIDRYEAQLIDKFGGEVLSPYYPPDPKRARRLFAQWEKYRAQSDSPIGRDLQLPELPDWQLAEEVEPMAAASARVVPSGYLDANTAERACDRAGKRLCTATEWVTACRGQQNRQFPYGSQYIKGACNVFREAHPAAILHGNASEGHLDPRLNLIEADGGPLLRKTGTTARCRSEWGNDAIYDMVGNLDEWVDDAHGAFHGGFFSRATRLGCDARISTHPRQYSDYSLGVRCCK